MQPVDLLVDASQRSLDIHAIYRDHFEIFTARDVQRENLLYRLTGYSVESDSLTLVTENTDYRQFRHTRNLQIRSIADRWTRVANPLAVCCVCRSSDRYLLVEKRSDEVDLYPGAFHVVGGYSEVALDRKFEGPSGEWVPDFSSAILREIDEELNTPVCLETLRLNGLLYDRESQHPELSYSIDLAATAAEAVVLTASTPEFNDIYPIEDDASKLKDFLFNEELRVVPTGWFALYLYGRFRFGQEWAIECYDPRQ